MITIILLAISYILHPVMAARRKDAPNPNPKSPSNPLLMVR